MVAGKGGGTVLEGRGGRVGARVAGDRGVAKEGEGMTKREAEAAEVVCEAATEGPWESDGKIVGWLSGARPAVAVWWWRYNRGSPVCMCQPDLSGRYKEGGTERPIEDAAFIACARTTLPAAIKMLKMTAQIMGKLRSGHSEGCICLVCTWFEWWEPEEGR